MKKICNLATMHPKGDTRIFRKECLAETQHYEVHYIACDGKDYELEKNVHIHGIKRYKSKFSRVMFAPFIVYRKAKLIDADIYVLHDPELLLIALLLKKRGKCVVWDCHEYHDHMMMRWSLVPRMVVTVFFRCIVHFIAPRLNGIVVPARELVKSFEKIQVKNIYLLHNYALLKEFKFVKMFDWECKQCIIFAGTFYPFVLDLIRALTLCRNDIRLVLCLRNGSTIDSNLLLKTPGFSKVDYKGNVSFGEIKRLYKRCFAGVFSPLAVFGNLELSPNKCYEYMAGGLPLVIFGKTKNAFLKDLIDNGGQHTGVYIDSDPQAIADAIDYLYENKEIARTMGENGRRAFETKYNFESEADGFLKFLEEVSQSKNQNR